MSNPIPDAPSTSRAFTADTLIRVRRLGAFDVSPDGHFAVAAVDELSDDGKRYDTNLYRIDLSSDASLASSSSDASHALVGLTHNKRRKSSPRFAPDGTLGFLAQPDPSARKESPPPPAEGAAAKPKADDEPPAQLHRMRLDGGEAIALTDLPCGVQAFEWAADGASVVLVAPVHAGSTIETLAAAESSWKDRKTSGRLFTSYPVRFWDHWYGPKHPHLLVGDGRAANLRDLTPSVELGLEETSGELSPDGRWACFDMRRIDSDLRFEQHLVLFDLRTGERRALTSGTGEHWGARWSPDGKRVACLHHRPDARVTGKQDIKVVDVATGDARLVTTDLDVWPERPIWADDRWLLFSCDERGHHVIKAFDVETATVRALTTEGHASELHLSPDKKTLYFALDRLDAPADLWAVPVAGGAVPRRITNLNAELLDGVPMARGESSSCTGCNDASVQAWEVRPPDFDESRKYPLLVWIHGGPIHSYLDQFHFRWNAQIYAAQGYVVVMVNPRGSTGFGQQFIQDNNGDWGNLCYQDLMRTVDDWSMRPYVDASRVAALGASFGGYMVNWIAGHDHRFRCLVSHAGLFNLPAFHGTTDCGPQWELEFGGVPWAHPEIYEEWSPHRHVASFKTPTLVVHGELDYRVPLGEGLQMFQALQKMQVPSEFLYFPDENHWILKPANMKLWNETVLAWLDRWMR